VLRGTWGLSRQALLGEVDAIHICKPHPHNGLAALLGRLARGRRLYLDCDDYEAESNRYGHGWQKQVVAFWEDRLPRFARGITVNTRFTQQRLERLGFRRSGSSMFRTDRPGALLERRSSSSCSPMCAAWPGRAAGGPVRGQS
jgi:hypothetical protein